MRLFSIFRLSSPIVSGNRRYFDLGMLQRYQASTLVFQHSLVNCQPICRYDQCLKPLLYCSTFSRSVLFSVGVHFLGVLLVCPNIPKRIIVQQTWECSARNMLKGTIRTDASRGECITLGAFSPTPVLAVQDGNRSQMLSSSSGHLRKLAG